MPKPKRRARASRAPRRRTISGIPPGFRTVTPYLSVDGGVKALELYKKAFGARELIRNLSPDGKLIHGRLKIGDSIVMLSDSFPGGDTSPPSVLGNTTVTIHLYTNDIDRLWARALAAGMEVSMPLADQFWGERYGHLRDPFGHRWSLGMRVKMSKAEREAKQREATAAFASGKHSGD
jgi:PhnB protein